MFLTIEREVSIPCDEWRKKEGEGIISEKTRRISSGTRDGVAYKGRQFVFYNGIWLLGPQEMSFPYKTVAHETFVRLATWAQSIVERFGKMCQDLTQLVNSTCVDSQSPAHSEYWSVTSQEYLTRIRWVGWVLTRMACVNSVTWVELGSTFL